MNSSLHRINQNGPASNPDVSAKLGDQIFGLEDAARACQENAAKLLEMLEPVLLPNPPLATGVGLPKEVPPACPIGDKLRELTGQVRHADEILQTIQRRLAIG